MAASGNSAINQVIVEGYLRSQEPLVPYQQNFLNEMLTAHPTYLMGASIHYIFYFGRDKDQSKNHLCNSNFNIAEYLIFSSQSLNEKIKIVLDILSIEQLDNILKTRYGISSDYQINGFQLMAVVGHPNIVKCVIDKLKSEKAGKKLLDELLFYRNSLGQNTAQFILWHRDISEDYLNLFIPNSNALLHEFYGLKDNKGRRFLSYLITLKNVEARQKKIVEYLEILSNSYSSLVLDVDALTHYAAKAYFDTFYFLCKTAKAYGLLSTANLFGNVDENGNSVYFASTQNPKIKDSFLIQNYLLRQLDFSNPDDVENFVNGFKKVEKIPDNLDLTFVPLAVLLRLPYSGVILEELKNKLRSADAKCFPKDLLNILSRKPNDELRLILKELAENVNLPQRSIILAMLHNKLKITDDKPIHHIIHLRLIIECANEHAITKIWPAPSTYGDQITSCLRDFSESRFKKGFTWLVKFFPKDILGAFLIAHCYQYGVGTQINIDSAIDYYLQALTANSKLKAVDNQEEAFSNDFIKTVFDRLIAIIKPDATRDNKVTFKLALKIYNYYLSVKKYDECGSIVSEMMHLVNVGDKLTDNLIKCCLELYKKTKSANYNDCLMQLGYGPAFIERAEKTTSSEHAISLYLQAIDAANSPQPKQAFKGIRKIISKIAPNIKLTLEDLPRPKLVATLKTFIALFKSNPANSDELIEALNLDANVVEDVIKNLIKITHDKNYQEKLSDLLSILPSLKKSLLEQIPVTIEMKTEQKPISPNLCPDLSKELEELRANNKKVPTPPDYPPPQESMYFDALSIFADNLPRPPFAEPTSSMPNMPRPPSTEPPMITNSLVDLQLPEAPTHEPSPEIEQRQAVAIKVAEHKEATTKKVTPPKLPQDFIKQLEDAKRCMQARRRLQIFAAHSIQFSEPDTTTHSQTPGITS